MGVGQREKFTYVSFMDGKVVIKAEPGAPGAVSRKNKKDNEVWETHHDYIEGFIIGISTVISQNADIGKQWVIDIHDGREKYVIQFPYSSGYARSFLKSLPNVDFTKMIRFSPYQKIVMENNKESKRTSVYLSHDPFGKENSIKWFFSKEEPNGLPEPEEVELNGKTQMNYTKQLNFFEVLLDRKIRPRMYHANEERINPGQFDSPGAETDTEPDYDEQMASMDAREEEMIDKARAEAKAEQVPDKESDLPF